MNPTNSGTAIEPESGCKWRVEHQPESPGMGFGFLGSSALAVWTYFNPNLKRGLIPLSVRPSPVK